MSELYTKYPLDLTGVSPDNLVISEPHTLASGSKRALVPNYGAFFVKGMSLLDVATGEELVPGEQYVPIMYYEEPSERAAMEVCAGVIVTDETVGDEVRFTYQVVGGDYINITPVIIQLIAETNLDDRAVIWGDLLGRPDAFPAAKHLHDLGDIYGFEYVVAALDRITEAILVGDEASHQEIMLYLEDRYQKMTDHINAVDSRLSDHKADLDNPHQVTKAQTGLGLVENYPPSDKLIAEQGSSTTHYMTPLRTAEAIDHQIGVQFRQHRDDQDNPHNVTKAQTGLGLVDNFATSTQTAAETGSSNSLFMTPLRTAQAIKYQVGTQFTAHKNDTGNPHQVTKAQVGLGSVINLPLADPTTAEAGTSHSHYMTPLRTAQAITALIGNDYNAHKANYSNPHNVTKAQVGLGSVDNYSRAYYDSRYGLLGTGEGQLRTNAQNDARFVNVTGDTMTGSITYRNVSSGSWARGLEGRDPNGLSAGIGILGNTDVVEAAYIGASTSPWSDDFVGMRFYKNGRTNFRGYFEWNGNTMTSESSGLGFSTLYGYTRIGMRDAEWSHYYSDSNNGHHFYNNVQVEKNLYVNDGNIGVIQKSGRATLSLLSQYGDMGALSMGAGNNTMRFERRDRAGNITGIPMTLDMVTGTLNVPIINDAYLSTRHSLGAMNVADGGTPGLEVFADGNAGHAAYMNFHRGGVYAVRFGLDTNNLLSVGGYSLGNNSYAIFHQGFMGPGSGLDAATVGGIKPENIIRNDAVIGGTLSMGGNAPWIELDSNGSGDNNSSQGAGISIGESGMGGGASVHLTYRGDGYSWLGMGGVSKSNVVPSNWVLQMQYQSRDAWFAGEVYVAGSYRALAYGRAGSGNVRISSGKIQIHDGNAWRQVYPPSW